MEDIEKLKLSLSKASDKQATEPTVHTAPKTDAVDKGTIPLQPRLIRDEAAVEKNNFARLLSIVMVRSSL